MPASPGQFALRDKLRIESVVIGERRYVAGLYWERMDTVHGAKRAIRERGAKHGFDVAADWLSSAVLQAGFGVSAQGAIPPYRSLAVAMGLAVGGDALIAVGLPDGRYAMVAVYNDAIHPGSDLLGSLDDVREAYGALLAHIAEFGHAINRLIAPPEIYPAAERVDVLPLLEPKASAGFLKRFQLPSPTPGTIYALTKGAERKVSSVKLYAGLGLVAAACVAGYVYNAQVQDAKLQKQIADLAAAARAKALLHKEPPPEPKPWIQQPTAVDLVSSCSVQMSKLPVAVGGWMLTTATCGYGHMDAVYLRSTSATVADLLGALSATLGLRPDIKPDGEQAGLTVGFDAPPKSAEDLAGSDAATTRFTSHFQAIDVKAQLTVMPPKKAPEGQPPLPPPQWKTYTWSVASTPVTAINTIDYPSLLLAGLDVPGLRIDSVTLSRTDEAPYLSWSVAGHLYAK